MRSSALALGMILASCSHVKTEALTADEHRNEAEIHAANAAEQAAQYDPSKARRPAPRGPGTTMFSQNDIPFESYNPSDAHIAAADQELEKANAHLAAARSLEAFEDKACAGLSAAERSSCPLFASSVRRVEWVKGGFKLTFKQPDVAGQTYARLRCHLAFAVASGFDQPSCPLFIKGTRLARDGADAIVFSSDSPEVASALRAQARRVFPPPGTPPLSSAASY